MSFTELIPCYSVAPYGVTLYQRPEQGYTKNISEKSLQNLKDNTNYYADLSANAQKRLKKRIDFMLYITNEKNIIGKQLIDKQIDNEIHTEKGTNYTSDVKYKLTFITLTLPSKQIHSDQEIKSKLLNQFLVELRKLHEKGMYIWKAEKQENGNIHFHILYNHYIKWQWIKSTWNRIVNKLGYVDGYQSKMKDYYKNGFKMSTNKNDKRTKKQQLKAYKKGKASDWTEPNSTDIHALYKVKNLGAYMTKYLTKGVTKTDRTVKIQELLNQKNIISQNVANISMVINQLSINKIDYSQYAIKLFNENNKLKKILKELKTLQNQGVTGKIWASSTNLNKLSNYTNIGYDINIPDYEIIDKVKEKIIINKIGKQNIVTVIFDLSKTPTLKSIFDNHLADLLNENEIKFNNESEEIENQDIKKEKPTRQTATQLQIDFPSVWQN